MSEAYEKFIMRRAWDARYEILTAEDQDPRSIAYREWRPRHELLKSPLTPEQNQERFLVLGGYRWRTQEAGFLGAHADLTPFLEQARAEFCSICGKNRLGCRGHLKID
jgi:hypothetical protein